MDCSYNLSPDELCAKISLCDALMVRSGTKVTRDVFESSGGCLKVVGLAGALVPRSERAYCEHNRRRGARDRSAHRHGA